MSELMSKIGNLTNRLREGFMELSPRDRALLSGMGVLFAGAALGGSIWWMDSRELHWPQGRSSQTKCGHHQSPYRQLPSR